jgi:hypothetical protein
MTAVFLPVDVDVSAATIASTFCPLFQRCRLVLAESSQTTVPKIGLARSLERCCCDTIGQLILVTDDLPRPRSCFREQRLRIARLI